MAFRRVFLAQVCFLLGIFGRASLHAQHSYRQGILIEENPEFPCAHECGPFEIIYFSFCVQSDQRIFLARLFDTRFNFGPNKLLPWVGKTIRFRNDDKNLWIVRPDGGEFHVRQSYTKGYFIDSRCVSELHRHLINQDPYAKTRPSGVAPDAVYVPLTLGVGYWTKCFLAADRAIVCFARGPKGEEFSHVYQPSAQVVTDADLAVDPLRTSYDTIVLATGETLTRKYD